MGSGEDKPRTMSHIGPLVSYKVVPVAWGLLSLAKRVKIEGFQPSPGQEGISSNSLLHLPCRPDEAGHFGLMG